MDVLGDILSSLRLTGGVILEGEAHGDWCVSSQMQADDVAALFPSGGHIIAYHYIREGLVHAQVEGQPAVIAGPGSVLLFPRNDQHMLYTRRSDRPIDSHQFLSGVTEQGLARFTIDGEGEEVSFYCGFLGVGSSHHPLLDSLPPMLMIKDVGEAQHEWLESNLRYLTTDRPSPEVVARIAELLFAQAIRVYLDETPEEDSGWLAGLRDAAVARTLGIIHSRYAEELEITELAREAGVSRTVLGERFAALIGEPPMRYCARWRMRVAANMLRDGKENTANIAYAVGFNSEAAFNRAFKREYGLPPVAWKKRVVEQERLAQERASSAALPRQLVHYCHAHDGTRLAFSAVGEGPPLVKTANWLNHIEHDWESPIWRHWVKALTREHCLIRYDERGNGLSDWDTPEISFDAFVDDLESVVDCAEPGQFDLLGISQGAAVAIAYAVRHPERVRRIVLCGGYAAGWARRAEPDEVARREAMMTLTEVGWGADNPAYRQMFTNLYIPGATHEQMEWFNALQRRTTSPRNAVALMRVFANIDVRELLPRVSQPTMIFHARDDMVVPFACGEALAAGIPNARFVPLESGNHILLGEEQAFATFVGEARRFLNGGSAAPAGGAVSVPASPSSASERIARARRNEELGQARSRDGTLIGYSAAGEGWPVVMPAVWYQEVASDWTSPVWQHWLAELLVDRRLIRSDLRGFGSSGPLQSGWSLDCLLGDFCCVLDALSVERFDLVAFAHGSLPALAFAARQPERVRKLVIVGGYAQGFGVRGDAEEISRRESLTSLARNFKGMADGTFAQMLGALYWPGARGETVDWLAGRLKVINQLDEGLQEVLRTTDLKQELPAITAETLFLHSRGDRVVNIACAEEAAADISGARLVPLDSDNHLVIGTEPAWTQARQALRAFLDS